MSLFRKKKIPTEYTYTSGFSGQRKTVRKNLSPRRFATMSRLVAEENRIPGRPKSIFRRR